MIEIASLPETRMTAIPPTPYGVDIAQIVCIFKIGYKGTTNILYLQVFAKKVTFLIPKIWIFEKNVLSLQKISRVRELANS